MRNHVVRIEELKDFTTNRILCSGNDVSGNRKSLEIILYVDISTDKPSTVGANLKLTNSKNPEGILYGLNMLDHALKQYNYF